MPPPGRGGPGRAARPAGGAGSASTAAGRSAATSRRRRSPRRSGHRGGHQHPGGAGGQRGPHVAADVARPARTAPRVVPSARAAACTRPGAGLRQAQPVGVVVRADQPGVEAARAAPRPGRCTARICSSVKQPRARPDWLVTTASRSPAARSRSSAARAPGTGRTFSGSPLYGTSSIRVPSRSSSTASYRTPRGSRQARNRPDQHRRTPGLTCADPDPPGPVAQPAGSRRPEE